MGFGDILKRTFLKSYSLTEITTENMLAALLAACLIGLYIFLVYRIVTRKAFYSKSFNISLVVLAMITAAIIMAIQSSVVVSLGMVGALSIVRFRTAIKDPMDLVFLFWSICIGIICGVGLFELGILTSVCVSLVIVVLELVPMMRMPMLLVVNTSERSGEKAIFDVVANYARAYHVKSRNITSQSQDMIIELRMKENCVNLIREIQAITGVESVSLLSNKGDSAY